MMKGKISKKGSALILAVALLVVGAGSGTLAWLSDKTDSVNNVFTTSNIEVTLGETTGNSYQMIPGWSNDKNPLVTVDAKSEDCWVFIEVEENFDSITVNGTTYSFDDFIAYKIDQNIWTKLSGESGNNAEGVYYCQREKSTSNVEIPILTGGTYTVGGVDYTWNDNQVLTKPDVTKEMMKAITDANMPTLSFTVYAVQYWKNNTTAFEPAEAWNIAKPSNQ